MRQTVASPHWKSCSMAALASLSSSAVLYVSGKLPAYHSRQYHILRKCAVGNIRVVPICILFIYRRWEVSLDTTLYPKQERTAQTGLLAIEVASQWSSPSRAAPPHCVPVVSVFDQMICYEMHIVVETAR